MDVKDRFKESLINFGSPIMICQTGSKAYGLDTPLSDDDYKAIFIPHTKHLIGLEKVEQVKIQGDCWVAHSVGHYVKRMIGQAPSLLELLFTEGVDFETYSWRDILKPALKKLVYKDAFIPYSEYVKSQLYKARNSKVTEKRQDLILEHGYDTKFMSHVARLAVQCMYLMREHYIPVRVPEPYRNEVLKIKTGKMNKHEALVYCEELQKIMNDAHANSTLQTSIDVDSFEKDVYIPLLKQSINESS